MSEIIIAALVVLLIVRFWVAAVAKQRALRLAVSSIAAQVELKLTLLGGIRRDKAGRVWGRVASPFGFTYRVEAGRNGQVKVTCQQLDKEGEVLNECSLTLSGSAFKAADSLALAEQAVEFVRQCWADYTPQPRVDAARKLGADLLGLVSRWF